MTTRPTRPLTRADFPLAETAPEKVRGARGKPLDALTLDAVMAGEVTIEDLRITPQALLAQAEIARDAGRAALAANFERAAELVHVPQDLIMETYEMLRPGRVKDSATLRARAAMLRHDHGAEKLAEFLETAAIHYQRRGLMPG
ncbi:diol dehydratase small subunit [Paracoccus sp. IB05]|uniref:diol dehydratase small subunit n=1 Tax=Paracoccus sp. IB05 TaxID=2779367 RepID=UPI0018E707F5|nr:diol dehydratase small subunit [Paracoccus sp. IB05]MBJ2149322.1 propanediol dehydratase small subunit PduE [Paracoccus sp. IB05]